jgi:hypothetical protein
MGVLNPMNRAHYPTYNKFVDLFLDNKLEKFSRYRDNTELSRVEKKLLESRDLLKSMKKYEAVELLESISTSSTFLDAEKNLVLAAILLSQSSFDKSLRYASQALHSFKFLKDSVGLFKVNYNISVLLNRLGNHEKSFLYIKEAEKNTSKLSDELDISRALACYYGQKNDFPNAILHLERVLHSLDHLNAFQQQTFLLVASDIFFRAGQKKLALNTVKKSIKGKMQLERARTSAYLHFIQADIFNKKLPRKPKSIKESFEYNLKWEIITNVQYGNQDELAFHWAQLHQLFPKIYSANYECINPSKQKDCFYTIFSKFYQVKADCKNYDFSTIKSKKGRKLLTILTSNQMSLRKEELIEMLWDVEYCTKFDNRFYKLIERVKIQSGVSIQNQSNSYTLQGLIPEIYYSTDNASNI